MIQCNRCNLQYIGETKRRLKDRFNEHRRTIDPAGVLGLMFAGYVPLASQSPYPILVYSLANYRPHLSHFLENIIFAIPT